MSGIPGNFPSCGVDAYLSSVGSDTIDRYRHGRDRWRYLVHDAERIESRDGDGSLWTPGMASVGETAAECFIDRWLVKIFTRCTLFWRQRTAQMRWVSKIQIRKVKKNRSKVGRSRLSGTPTLARMYGNVRLFCHLTAI